MAELKMSTALVDNAGTKFLVHSNGMKLFGVNVPYFQLIDMLHFRRLPNSMIFSLILNQTLS